MSFGLNSRHNHVLPYLKKRRLYYKLTTSPWKVFYRVDRILGSGFFGNPSGLKELKTRYTSIPKVVKMILLIVDGSDIPGGGGFLPSTSSQ